MTRLTIAQHVEEMMRHQSERLERAVRLVAGIPPRCSRAEAERLALECAATGVYIAHHDIHCRRSVEIRDRDDGIIWSGWWESEETALTWREEWTAERRPHAAG